MRESVRVVFAGGIAAAVVLMFGVLSAQTVVDPVASSAPRLPGEFAGFWDYNAAESVNIVTGRPEQSPRSAILRGASGRSVGAGPEGGRGSGVDGGGSRRGSLGLGPTPEMMREARDMTRDLLEVPEALTIAVDDSAVTFTDDIEREHTYWTDGRKEKYRLGAAQFNARLEWTGSQLRKEIEGEFGFRMSEVYFLSPDGSRLFVIIRVGATRRNAQPVGVNRVYDRVDAIPAAERVSSR